MALAAAGSAHAQMPGGAHAPAPSALAAAAPAAPSAVVTSTHQPAPRPLVRRAALHPALARVAPAPLAAQLSCRARAEFTRLHRPLARTARRLAGGKPLVIVAIGSSSTAGAGASSPAASYPSRLAVELARLLPGHAIEVLNRGVNGEEAPNMLARFATGVIAQHPQLVLWQLGTNSVLRGRPLQRHSALLREGIEELKATGADVVLIDPQYAPKVLAKPETPAMVAQIARAAQNENVGLFRRFAVMRGWYESQHRSFALFVSADGLHMNDWGYACWAKLLAASIAAAAGQPLTAAAAHPGR